MTHDGAATTDRLKGAPRTCARVWLQRVGLALLGIVLLLPAGPGRAQEKASLQLKWLHQFQFAGYYAALEQGFYRDAGLEVEIREGGPTIDAPVDVAAGKADFGVCTTNALLQNPGAGGLVVLAAIFQHSPAIILAPSRTHIGSVADLQGHTLMDAPGSDDIAAMLKSQGVDYARLPRVQHDGDPRGLVSGDADIMVAYSTNEPYVLDQLGVPYRSFSPRAFGFDFYGDALCTSAAEAVARPAVVRAFRAASLKGWAWALAHKQETVELILSRYSLRKSREALLFEAERSQALIQPELVAIGTQTRERWEAIAGTYRDLGMRADPEVPAGLIYGADGGGLLARLLPVLLGLGAFAVVAAAFRFLYRRIVRRLALSLRKPKLGAVMAALFVGLMLPVLVFILILNHQRNSAAIIETLRENVAKTRQANIETIETMLEGVASTLRVLAQMAATDPDYFRRQESSDTLFQALISAPEIDAVSVSFEDEFYRVVTRIDADRRRSDSRIPASANWHSSYADAASAGKTRRRHSTFFDTWGHAVGAYERPSDLDPRSLPGYAAARESGSIAVSPPTIDLVTGGPILYFRHPIFRDRLFIGCASVDITFDVIARYLATHRASPNSTSVIADPTDGTILSAADRALGARVVAGKLEVARLDNAGDPDLREADRLHTETGRDEFVFDSPRDGREISASFTRFPNSLGRPREAIILTPTDDFVGYLKSTDRQIAIVIVVSMAVELALILFLTRRLARPIESVSRELESVESLSFEPTETRPSAVREIAQLQSAAALLRNSLRSISSFAPLELVRGLVKSGIALAPGVEARHLTVFFSDLEDFSAHAERSSPGDLLRQMSVYFEQVSRAVQDEEGTVDKFIGDGVMAFWGAPAPLADHALRGCRGALRSARRMDAVNAAWAAEGRSTFRIRIGMHSASVLVGNVGSSDRFSYTVMGDGVNIASRLEGMNKEFGTRICISDSMVEALGVQILARPLRRVRVKGREQDFMIYELLGIAGSVDAELGPGSRDDRLCELTRSASARFEAGDMPAAAAVYREILREFPGDPVATAMLRACGRDAAAEVAGQVREPGATTAAPVPPRPR